ncbi:MAG: hypothetical protein LBM71_02540 [Elusimicrobiota bacterium]|jgi:mannose/fructose-specific phosphotransferase system component IIA|nr:hypothetical protein [Elusimicrobiota bacterium]
MVKIILVSHGDMAQALLNTAEKIYPFDPKSVDVFTVSGCVNWEGLSKKIKSSLGAQGALILVDVFGGSSCNMAATLTHGIDGVNVVSGVNLNMLLAALNNRDKMTSDELAKKVIEDGLKAVVNVTQRLK